MPSMSSELKKEAVVEHHRDRFAQAAGEWRDMTFSERIPYEDMARADKDRHQKDLDIASRNLNAALLGSVPKHGQGMCSGVGFPGLKALAANSPHEDVCAVCKEEGDLLCCDFCPATHHLTCLDPPMLALPSDDVQWACPACSARVEVTEMTAPQQKPKRERKDGKKRQRASSATAGSPRGPDGGADTSITIPKRKKEQKRAKAQGAQRGGASAKEGLESQTSPRVKTEGNEGKPAQDAAAGGRGGGSVSRIVKPPKQPRVLPRMGLGLTDAAAAEVLAMRGPDLCDSTHARSPSNSMMSLAVAAASVAASEAAAAAAVSAAAAVAATAAATGPPPAPAPPAPPKALGLKKRLHQRVRCDEASANPTSAFSPKKLLKHRLLAAQANQQQASLAPPPTPTSATIPAATPTPAAAPALAPTPKVEDGGFGYGGDERNEPSPRGDPLTTGREPCEGGRFEGSDNGNPSEPGGGDGGGGGGGGGGGLTASRERKVAGQGFGGGAMFGGEEMVVAADGTTVNGGHVEVSEEYGRRYRMGAGGGDNGCGSGNGGSGGGGGGGAGGDSGGGFNSQGLGGEVGSEESFGDSRNRALVAGGDEAEVAADQDRGLNSLNGMHVASGVRSGDPQEEAMRFSQGADAAERGHGGGGDAERWPGEGAVEGRDAPRGHEHPATSFGRRHPYDGQELYNGDGDDLLDVDSACQQIGRTKGSDSSRKISAHRRQATQRSLSHGQGHDYPPGGPEVKAHERSDRVPQSSTGGYTDAAFPPSPRWDGDRRWNSDGANGAERDGRPELGGGVEVERERFARRSGVEMDGNEPHKALANGGPSVHPGAGISHGRSLAGGAPFGGGLSAAARRGEELSSLIPPRQHGAGGGRRGVWAGVARSPSRLDGDHGSERGAVDGGSRRGSQRFGSVESGRNGGVGERAGGRGGGGGGGTAGSEGGRFTGWSERKRPLERLGAEDGTRESPKKLALTNPGDTEAPPRASRSQPNRWNGESATVSRASPGASFDSRGRPRATTAAAAAIDAIAAMPSSKKSRNSNVRDHHHENASRQHEEGPWAGTRRDRRGDAGVRPSGSDRSSVGRSREQARWNDRYRDDATPGSSKGSDTGWDEACDGAERAPRGGGGEPSRAGRGHWKARLANRDDFLPGSKGKTTARASGGSRDARDAHDAPMTGWRGVGAERRRGDHAREVPTLGTGGRDVRWQERTVGGAAGKGEASAGLGGRQGGRLDEPMRNDSAGGGCGSGGGGRVRSQGERERGWEVGGSVHPLGRYPGGRGGSVGPGVGGDRQMRETSFRPGPPAMLNGGGGRGGGGGGGPPRPNRSGGGNDYSRFAAPKHATSIDCSSSSVVAATASSAAAGAALATGYAALAAPARTTSLSRPARGGSQERDQGQRHRSMARSSTSSGRGGSGGGGGGGGLPPFHPRRRSESGGRGGRGVRQQGESKGVHAAAAFGGGGGGGGGGGSRSLRSRSPPSRSSRSSTPTKNLSRQGGNDAFALGGGGGVDDGYSRLGKSRPAWESGRQGGAAPARGARGRRAGPGGPKPWQERGESASGHSNDRFGRRADNGNRYLPSGDRRGSFSGRMEGGGGGRGRRGRGRGRGWFENRHNSIS